MLNRGGDEKMGGYLYGEKEPTETCPYCGDECGADFADIGVGMTQVGPYHCMNCHASEIGSYDKPRELTEQEQKTGWYAPGAEPGSSANVIDGRVVSHREADAAYRGAFYQNPEWAIPGAVDKWREKLRKKWSGGLDA